VGRDIAAGRLGVYFARPLSAAAIWGGKMLGALALLLGAVLLACLPIYFLANPFEPAGPVTLRSEPVMAMTLLWMLLLSTGAAAAGALRSRSGLLIVDIVGLPIVVAAFLWVGERMVDAGATRVVFSLATPPRMW